jgi:hypothetical protein
VPPRGRESPWARAVKEIRLAGARRKFSSIRISEAEPGGAAMAFTDRRGFFN